MNHPTVTIVEDAEDLAAQAAERFVQAAGEAIRGGKHFTAALAGGSTPEKLYTRLARPDYAARIDWQQCALFLGDERFVPLDDPRSNYALIRRTLLASATVPPGRVYPVPVHLPTADDAAAAYQET